MPADQSAHVPILRSVLGARYEILAPYLKWTMLAMLVLGFASGLPLMMVFQKLSNWLRELGISRSSIGYLYFVSIAYSLKFVWAPVVDRVRVPVLHEWLGPRRAWMLVAVMGTVIGLLIIGFSNPAATFSVPWLGEGVLVPGLVVTAVGAGLLAYSGATLDIAIDAWRIESAPDEEQANMAAVYNLGYRFAIMFSGVGLWLAGAFSWTIAYGVMAVTMGVIAALILVIREPQGTQRPTVFGGAQAGALIFGVVYLALFGVFAFLASKSVIAVAGLDFKTVYVFFPLLGVVAWAVYQSRTMWQSDLRGTALFGVYQTLHAPFGQLQSRLGVWLLAVLALVAFYRMSDFTMGVMAMPLYIDAGYAKSTIGLVQSGMGPWVVIFGGLLGGFAALRLGLIRALLVGAVLTLVTNAAYAAFAQATSADAQAMALSAARSAPYLSDALVGAAHVGREAPATWMLFGAIAGDNIAGGYVTTVFIAYMSSLTDRAYAATQYAIFSSLYAVLPKLMAGFSGVLADAVGYPPFFLLTACWAIPAGILVWVVMRYGSAEARGEVPAQGASA